MNFIVLKLPPFLKSNRYNIACVYLMVQLAFSHFLDLNVEKGIKCILISMFLNKKFYHPTEVDFFEIGLIIELSLLVSSCKSFLIELK